MTESTVPNETQKMLLSASLQLMRDIISRQGVNRAALDEVKAILLSLTREDEAFGEARFPSPTPEQVVKVYLLSDDDGGDFSLYLVSTLSSRPSPVHDHGTWAIIAGMAGDEENTIYRRLDDGAKEGVSRVEEDHKIVISAGDGIAFMPDDIHHIRSLSAVPTRHFHLYGKGFVQQTDRVEFDIEVGTNKKVSGSFVPVDASRRIL